MFTDGSFKGQANRCKRELQSRWITPYINTELYRLNASERD